MTDFYGTLAGFKAYWMARGDPVTAATSDDDILVNLLMASEWIDAAFVSQFAGYKVGLRAQIREWPRGAVLDVNGYYVANDVPPREIENATYEAAKRNIVSPGIFFKDYTPSKYKSVSISGAIAVEYNNFNTNAESIQTQFPAIVAILAPILTAAGVGGFSSLSGSMVRT